MAFDYKKEYKEFYMPKNKPGIIEIPKMNYIAVRACSSAYKIPCILSCNQKPFSSSILQIEFRSATIMYSSVVSLTVVKPAFRYNFTA